MMFQRINTIKRLERHHVTANISLQQQQSTGRPSDCLRTGDCLAHFFLIFLDLKKEGFVLWELMFYTDMQENLQLKRDEVLVHAQHQQLARLACSLSASLA